jgi:membrane protease YdiL (CAAX protease family)
VVSGSATDRRAVAKLVWFVVLAYALSWAWWIPLAISGTIVDQGQGWPTHLIGLMGPMFAAIIVTGLAEGRTGLVDLASRTVRWRVNWIWYGVVAATATLTAIPLMAKSSLRAGDVVLYSGAPPIGVTVVLYVLVVNGFGEEIGWRGFLADRLLQKTSRGRTALIVWPIWALWHLPLFWIVASFRDFGVGGTIGWAVGIGFGSVFLTWLYSSAGRSILIVALWHSAYNFASATEASSGLAAAVATTAVIVASVIILRRPSTWRSPDIEVSAALERPG